MRKGNLTREEAVAIVGEAAVAKVDAADCDFTNRVGYNGACQGDEEVEFDASVACEDADGVDVSLVAYYYQDAEDVEASEGLDTLDWVIYGYEII